MNKYIIALIAAFAVFGLTGNAQAQLPFPGQSVPNFILSTWIDNDGIFTLTVQHNSGDINHHYYLKKEQYLLRRLFIGHDPLMGPFTTSNDYPACTTNTDTYGITSNWVASTYGPGDYTYKVNYFAYNPSTGVKIFLWEVSYDFMASH